jgi:hypothetical protein
MAILLTVATLLLCIPSPPVSNENAASKLRDAVTQQTKNEPTPIASAASLSHTGNSETSKNSATTEPEGSLYKVYLVSGPLIVIVTVATVILVWRQIRVMRQVERAQVDLDFVAAGGFSYKVLLSNYGKSVATLTAYSLIHATYPLTATHLTPETALAKFEDKIPLRAILGPGILQREWTTYDLRQFLPMEALSNSNTQVIISGLIEYEDIFGRHHQTEVVYRFRVLPASPQVVPLWEYGKNT